MHTDIHRIMSDINTCYGEKQSRVRGQKHGMLFWIEPLKKDSVRR